MSSGQMWLLSKHSGLEFVVLRLVYELIKCANLPSCHTSLKVGQTRPISTSKLVPQEMYGKIAEHS